MRKHKMIKDISMGETLIKVIDKSMSIHDMYVAALREDENRKRPYRQLLRRMAVATGCSMETARLWALGFVRPGKLARQVLAKEFGVRWETLFPEIAAREREKEERKEECCRQ